MQNLCWCFAPLCIRFDKVDGFISIYDGTRYLLLFDPGRNMMSFSIGINLGFIFRFRFGLF